MRGLTRQARAVLALCRAAGLKVATAESCTGGLVTATLTRIAGSSDVVERGFVTYSNEAKNEMLDVPAALIARHGAVSAEVAQAMAEGALARSRADIAVSITGVAGPGGGTARKPVGLVHLAAVRRGGQLLAEHEVFPGTREQIRRAAVARAMQMVARLI